MSEKPLNRVEVWVAEHAVPIFLTIAVAIIVGAAAVFFTWERSNGTAEKVHVLEPQVTKINRAICDRRSLGNDARARACAERIRIGLINCRRSTRCRAAYLALATFPPEPARGATSSPEPSSGSPRDTGGGDAVQPPSHQGHQPPGPGKGPGSPAGAAPSPSRGPEGSGAPEPSPGGEEAAGSGKGGSNSSSGAGVEVCLLESCAAVEVGLGH